MKMSAARIRSVFRRHHGVQEQAFRFPRIVSPRTAGGAPTSISGTQPPAPSAHLEALDQHYRTAMKRELTKLGL